MNVGELGASVFPENYGPLKCAPALKEADVVDHVLSREPRSTESLVLYWPSSGRDVEFLLQV